MATIWRKHSRCSGHIIDYAVLAARNPSYGLRRDTTIEYGPHGSCMGNTNISFPRRDGGEGGHDMNPTSSVYFVTNRGQGNLATSGARVLGGSMPVDIVVMHGAFSNPKWSTDPLGAPAEKGNTLVVIVEAQNGSVVDMGMMTQNTHQASAMVAEN